RVVEEDDEPLMLVLDPSRECDYVLLQRDIAPHEGRLATGLADLVLDSLTEIAATTAKQDVRPFGGEQPHHRLADPAASAGDQRDVTFKSHRLLLNSVTYAT